MKTRLEAVSRKWISLKKWHQMALRIPISILLLFLVFGGVFPLSEKLLGEAFRQALEILLGFFAIMSLSIAWTDAVRIKDLNDRLKEASLKDSLTGIWSNRDFLMDTIRRMCSRGKRNGELLVILFIDADDFKEINTRHGHVAGDNAIAVMAETISHCLREDDFLFRYGGDEFLALLLLKKASEKELWTELDTLKERINSHFKNLSFFHGKEKVEISVSIGEHFVDMDSRDFKTEIEAGSRKMNEEKKKRKA